MSRFSVVCLDMAGTTVRDDNTVMDAFAAAIASRNLPVREFNSAMKYARATMGQSKIEVFRHILGDEDAAQAANAAFEKHYAGAVAARRDLPDARRGGAVRRLPGGRDTGLPVHRLRPGHPGRDRGRARLGLAGRPVPVPRRRRPRPALAGHAADRAAPAGRRLGVRPSPSSATPPPTSSAGLRAGAGLVVGVLSGDSARADLEAVPAAAGLPGTPLILDSVADLLPHLG